MKNKGEVHQAFLPKGFLGAVNDNPYKLDVAKAKELLAKAGLQGRLHGDDGHALDRRRSPASRRRSSRPSRRPASSSRSSRATASRR